MFSDPPAHSQDAVSVVFVRALFQVLRDRHTVSRRCTTYKLEPSPLRKFGVAIRTESLHKCTATKAHTQEKVRTKVAKMPSRSLRAKIINNCIGWLE